MDPCIYYIHISDTAVVVVLSILVIGSVSELLCIRLELAYSHISRAAACWYNARDFSKSLGRMHDDCVCVCVCWLRTRIYDSRATHSTQIDSRMKNRPQTTATRTDQSLSATRCLCMKCASWRHVLWKLNGWYLYSRTHVYKKALPHWHI